MVFQYYPDSDMLTIRFTDEASTESEEIAPGVVLDFDADNRVIGVEIEDASKFMDLSRLELKSLPLTEIRTRMDADGHGNTRITSRF